MGPTDNLSPDAGDKLSGSADVVVDNDVTGEGVGSELETRRFI